MSTDVPVSYNEDSATPVPTVWRKTLIRIIEAFKHNDLVSIHHIEGVQLLELEHLQEIAENITDYGETLVSLPDETWHSSQALWMGDYWYVILDLFTEREGRSDLILSIRVFETDGVFEYLIQDIYVP
ncbi:hypothetical protein MMO38_14390 [Acinetobacter sp. NIPH 1852]|uniref:DUF7668 domain-containing protein n=1 Tax=unclassified Acinetobacter TaxID=196816 RepID=UPI001F4B4D84|nr:hypothetical protein [Acinetobacter sp. NIPH 1852]MCH7309311.1 hypothetical protein [Acinetobacter sp. NIPH 1852]MDR7017209.1 hypothetical protein [Prolinoborus sp. 3657]